MSKRKTPSRASSFQICRTDENLVETPGKDSARSAAGAKNGRGPPILPADNIGDFTLVTRKDVLATPKGTSRSKVPAASPHTSCKLDEEHEFDEWCSGQSSDSDSDSSNASDSDSSAEEEEDCSTSDSPSGEEEDAPASPPSPSPKDGKTKKQPRNIEDKFDSKNAEEDVDIDGSNEDATKDGSSEGEEDNPNEEGGDQQREEDSGEGEEGYGEAESEDNESTEDDNKDDEEDEGANERNKTPEGKPGPSWFQNQMETMIDQRLGPDFVVDEHLRADLLDIVQRHEDFAKGILHSCEKCKGLPHQDIKCTGYKLLVHADGTRYTQDESKERFKKDTIVVINFHLEEAREAKRIKEPELPEQARAYLWETHEDRLKRRVKYSTKLRMEDSAITGVSLAMIDKYHEWYEADRKERKPNVRYNKDWKVGTELLKTWQNKHLRYPTREEYQQLAKKTKRTVKQVRDCLKQYRKVNKIVILKGSNKHMDDDDDEEEEEEDELSNEVPDSVNQEPQLPRESAATKGTRSSAQGSDSEGGKPATLKWRQTLRSKNGKDVKKRQAGMRRLSAEGPSKVPKTAGLDNVDPQASGNASSDESNQRPGAYWSQLRVPSSQRLATPADESNNMDVSKSRPRKRQASYANLLSEEGPSKVAKTNAAISSGSKSHKTQVEASSKSSVKMGYKKNIPKPTNKNTTGSKGQPGGIRELVSITSCLDNLPLHFVEAADLVDKTNRHPRDHVEKALFEAIGDDLDGINVVDDASWDQFEAILNQPQPFMPPTNLENEDIGWNMWDNILAEDLTIPDDQGNAPDLSAPIHLEGDELFTDAFEASAEHERSQQQDALDNELSGGEIDLREELEDGEIDPREEREEGGIQSSAEVDIVATELLQGPEEGRLEGSEILDPSEEQPQAASSLQIRAEQVPEQQQRAEPSSSQRSGMEEKGGLEPNQEQLETTTGLQGQSEPTSEQSKKAEATAGLQGRLEPAPEQTKKAEASSPQPREKPEEGGLESSEEQISKQRGEAIPRPELEVDFDNIAQIIFETMCGRLGKTKFPSVQDEIAPTIQKYKSWSTGNLQHHRKRCNVSADPKLCCYKDFDPSKNPQGVVRDFEVVITRIINNIIQNTPNEKIRQTPKFALDILRGYSQDVGQQYNLTAEEKQTLADLTGLTGTQVIKWWYTFHVKAYRKRAELASLKTNQEAQTPQHTGHEANANPPPTSTMLERRRKYFSGDVPREGAESNANLATTIHKPGQQQSNDMPIPPMEGPKESNKQRSGAPTYDNKGKTIVQEDPEEDMYDYPSDSDSDHGRDPSSQAGSCQPSIQSPNSLYDETAERICEEMGGIKRKENIPQMDSAIKPIIKVYKNWIAGKVQHLDRNCETSTNPKTCCWNRKFGTKSPEEVLRSFQVEVTRTLNSVILDAKQQNPKLKVFKFPDFAVEVMRRFSSNFESFHTLLDLEYTELIKKTGLRRDQIGKWWHTYHNTKFQSMEGSKKEGSKKSKIPRGDTESNREEEENLRPGEETVHDITALSNIFEGVVDYLLSLGWTKAFLSRHSIVGLYPDYSQFVRKPMSLDTIRKRAHQMMYKSRDQFCLDMKKIALDAHQYHDNKSALKPNPTTANLADALVDLCENALNSRRDELQVATTGVSISKTKPKTKGNQVDMETLANIFEAILDKLVKLPGASIFIIPVSEEEAPDYLKFVKKPIHVDAIRENIRQLQYQSPEEFRTDVNQIVLNAHQYNDNPLALFRNPNIPNLADALLKRCDEELRKRKREIYYATDRRRIPR